MHDEDMTRSRLAKGNVRTLRHQEELPLLRDHLLRLDRESRHDRFNGFMDDRFIERYAAKCADDGTVIMAYIEDGAVRGAAELVSSGTFPLGTAASHASKEILDTASLVKVVVADDGRAMYFSRAPIPYLRDQADRARLAQRTLQHIGVYAYSREALREWISLPPHPLEEIERLEQLRPLAAGLPIGVAITNEAPASGIDTEEDLAHANERWDAFMTGAVRNAG